MHRVRLHFPQYYVAALGSSFARFVFSLVATPSFTYVLSRHPGRFLLTSDSGPSVQGSVFQRRGSGMVLWFVFGFRITKQCRLANRLVGLFARLISGCVEHENLKCEGRYEFMVS